MTEIAEATAAFPDEVVTHAKLAVLDLPLGAGKAALITLDNGFDHTKPNTFGPGGLASLDEAITAAEAVPGVVAICVTGKPFIFAVGADLTGVPKLTDREQARRIGAFGHAVHGPARDRQGADLRVRQRRGDGRRRRAGAALHLSHHLVRRCGVRAARGLPWPDPGLGRRVAAAEPDRAGQGSDRHHRQPDGAEQDAQAGPGRRPRHRRPSAGAGRLPRAVAPMGGQGGARRCRRSNGPS